MNNINYGESFYDSLRYILSMTDGVLLGAIEPLKDHIVSDNSAIEAMQKKIEVITEYNNLNNFIDYNSSIVFLDKVDNPSQRLALYEIQHIFCSLVLLQERIEKNINALAFLERYQDLLKIKHDIDYQSEFVKKWF